jgi:hypothetical protein
VFVADGLRRGSVNATDTPALWSVRRNGVDFENSHSLFPTFTMANASAIATGYGLGDTGIFSNVIWTGFATFSGTPVPFLENDRMMADISAHLQGHFPNETTFLAVAAQRGYNTASVGKVGPSGLLNQGHTAPLIIDDSTGTETGFPLPRQITDEMQGVGLPADAPTRSNGYGATSPGNNGYGGTFKQAGTRLPNGVQQQWFADVTTRVILPTFKKDASKPFALMYWSRDPDGTQHNEGDSLAALTPGINGNTVRMALRNVDHNLKQILDWLDANPTVKANTDVFVTSDHGFATISKTEIAPGVRTSSESAKHSYVDIAPNQLPYGFLAIDLALALKTNLFDPDRRAETTGSGPFRQVRLGPGMFEHPSGGNGLIGAEIKREDGGDAIAIVAANGGSDLIYVPSRNVETVKQVVKVLTAFDYVGGIFVDDMYGPVTGALPMSAVGLTGSTVLPHPAIAVAFKVFYQTPGNLLSAVQISDASQQQGQGMHGGIGRDSTLNNMAVIGPDFKSRFVDRLPVGNADIAPTLAHILGLNMSSHGRILMEALRDGVNAGGATANQMESMAAGNLKTIIYFQEFRGIRYVDRGCFCQ